MMGFFFFKQKTAYEMRISDWSSDVCSSDLNRAVKFISSHMRITPELHGQHFFVKTKDAVTGKVVTAGTPLFLALVVINLADLVLAVESVRAIFAITTDTCLVYTSNILPLLGLPAPSFVLAALVTRFNSLQSALTAVLGFLGAELLNQGLFWGRWKGTEKD